MKLTNNLQRFMVKQAFLGFGNWDAESLEKSLFNANTLDINHPNFDEIIARQAVLDVIPKGKNKIDDVGSFAIGDYTDSLLQEFEDKIWDPYRNFDQMPEYIDRSLPLEHPRIDDHDWMDTMYDEVTTKSPYAKARRDFLRNKKTTLADFMKFIKKWRGKDSYGRNENADYSPMISREILDLFNK